MLKVEEGGRKECQAVKIPAAFRSVRVSNQLRHGSLWLCRLTGEDKDVVAYVVRAWAAKRPTRRGRIVLEGALSALLKASTIRRASFVTRSGSVRLRLRLKLQPRRSWSRQGLGEVIRINHKTRRGNDEEGEHRHPPSHSSPRPDSLRSRILTAYW
jgi:hypothetical protein